MNTESCSSCSSNAAGRKREQNRTTRCLSNEKEIHSTRTAYVSSSVQAASHPFTSTGGARWTVRDKIRPASFDLRVRSEWTEGKTQNWRRIRMRPSKKSKCSIFIILKYWRDLFEGIQDPTVNKFFIPFSVMIDFPWIFIQKLNEICL